MNSTMNNTDREAAIKALIKALNNLPSQAEKGTWEAHAEGWHWLARLARSDGLDILAQFNGTRAELYPTAPAGYLSYTGDQPNIGVSLTRDPQALARDIERRLLPAAEAWTRKCQEQLDGQKAAEENRLRIAAALVEAGRGIFQDGRRSAGEILIRLSSEYRSGSVFIIADIAYRGDVKIIADRLTQEQAEKVLALLSTFVVEDGAVCERCSTPLTDTNYPGTGLLCQTCNED